MAYNNTYGIQAVDEETFNAMEDAVPVCIGLIHRCGRLRLCIYVCPSTGHSSIYPTSHLLIDRPTISPHTQLPERSHRLRLRRRAGVLQRRHREQIRGLGCVLARGERGGGPLLIPPQPSTIHHPPWLRSHHTCTQSPKKTTGLNVYDIRIPCEVPGLCYDFSNVEVRTRKQATLDPCILEFGLTPPSGAPD